MLKKVHVVSHTHWDREWYFTIEDSNILLGENLNTIIKILNKNPEYKSYTLDAQSSLIEEFLKLYPERYDELKELIKNRRLFIGPWYTQTDTLLVNKESIIRNLYYGINVAESMGYSLNVGYIPDVFGQNAYLPSIFRDFNIDYSILKRGVYLKNLNKNDNFIWSSPDGKEIQSHYMSVGYSPGEHFDSSNEYINDNLLPMIEKIDNFNYEENNLLYFAGGDQNLINSLLPEQIKVINKNQDKYYFEQSDLEKFMKSISKKNIKNKILGELRDTGNQRIHRTIGSMRYDIKELNSQIENKILYNLEPLYAMGTQFGIEYPQKWLDIIWKSLFDVHAHDSIGGCNSDDTNEEILNRLKKNNRMVDGLINLVKKKITKAISKNINFEKIIVVFNTNITENKNFNSVVTFTRDKNFDIKDLNEKKVISEITSQTYISGGKKIVLTEKGDVEEELPGYYRSELIIKSDIKPMGWKTFVVEEGGSKENSLCKDNKISNENLEVTVNLKSIDIKWDGLNLEDSFYFENCGDFGDSYDFSPLKNDIPIKLKTFEIISIEKREHFEKITFLTKSILPKDLDERKQKINSQIFEIETTFELRQGENYIRISHKINNNIKDHRIRSVFKTPFENIKESYCDNGFSLIKHETDVSEMKDWREQGFVEAPIPIYNMENIALVREKNLIMGAITEGIKEYEILNHNSLALTLFRGVGLLGRDNLEWRPNRASGINNTVVHTPMGQLQKQLNFQYGLYFNHVEKDYEIFRNVDTYIKELPTYQNQNLNSLEERLERFNIPLLENKNIPEEFSLFKVESDSVFMSVCKLSKEKDSIIIRLFNPDKNDTLVTITGNTLEKICETTLLEKENIEIKNIVIPPKGYKTFKLFFKAGINEK